MTVAVKDMQETNTPKPFDRLVVESFTGVVYVLASLWLVFYGLNWMWWTALGLKEGAVSVSLLIVAMVAAAGGLVVLGTRLVGPQPRAGLKTGVAFGILALLVVAGVASLAGSLLEHSAQLQPAIGIPVTAAVAVGLLFVVVQLYSRPGFQNALIVVEEQGWFKAEAYKKNQGLRVRRGTMLGLLILAGCGVYTMLVHQTLVTGPRDYEIPIPYTGKALITRPGDAENLEKGQVVSADDLRKANEDLVEIKVRVTNPGDSKFQMNQVVSKEEFDKEDAKLKEQKKLQPTKTEPIQAEAKSYPRVTLLPDVMYTLPILLAVAALWLSYRVVNYPTFADFLIATEAELNKVSWTTQRRLVQDTIVVLVTVFLLTMFLFVVDQVWAQALTAIKVLKLPETGETEKGDEVPW